MDDASTYLMEIGLLEVPVPDEGDDVVRTCNGSLVAKKKLGNGSLNH